MGLAKRLVAPTGAARPRLALSVSTLIHPVRSTEPSKQACRVAVEDRSAGFAHATERGAPTIEFA